VRVFSMKTSKYLNSVDPNSRVTEPEGLETLNFWVEQHRLKLDEYQESIPPHVKRQNEHLVSDDQLMSEAFAVNYGVVDDGFGNYREKCYKDCQLQVVRPGDIRCEVCDEDTLSSWEG
jgi:hypothetical protein